MTAKRFTINNRDFNDKIETYELNCISDNENKTFYFIADSIENVQLFVKRLNELHEENQELKRLVKVTVEDYTDLKQSFDLIDKENEQLKKDILRLMYTAEHLVNIKKLEEKWNIDYNQFLSDLMNGDEHL